MPRALKALYWAGPCLLCLLLYWNGLRVWFQMDDFAWLGLHMQVHDFDTFVQAMFKPYAQGTIRPWSERLYFTGFFWLFGMDALPYRMLVFATMFANLMLLMLIMRRLTGSALAAFLAPVLWVVNSNIYIPMAWTAAYNQIQCSFFLLLAFYLFVRYTETGERRFYWSQFAVFVLGLGSLEINVVYPAIAAVFAILCARKYVLPTAPMFVVSGVYTIIHRAVAPKQGNSVYTMQFDLSLIDTFITYCRWMLGADRYAWEIGLSFVPFLVFELIVAVALLWFVVYKLRNRQWLPLFFLAWFGGVLAPVLPLRNHITDYYLTIPAIGFAMLGGWAFAETWRGRTGLKILAAVILLLYAIPSAWLATAKMRNYYVTSTRVRHLVQHVAYAHKLHPDKVFIIKGVDTSLFWAAFHDKPFRIFGRTAVYITPEVEHQILRTREQEIWEHFLSEDLILGLLRSNRAIVYEVVDHRLRNVSNLYRAYLESKPRIERARWIDVGSPLFAGALRDGWYSADNGIRWSAKRATVALRGPAGPQGTLHIIGHAPAVVVKDGPVSLTVTVDGKPMPPARIDATRSDFALTYPLPPEMGGRPSLSIQVEVDRTITVPPDRRELGLAFGRFEVTP